MNGLLSTALASAPGGFWAAAVGVLALPDGHSRPYELMVAGRFIFGISEGGKFFIALVAGLAHGSRARIALATALYLSLAPRRFLRGSNLDRPWPHPVMKSAGTASLIRTAITHRLAAPRLHWLDVRIVQPRSTASRSSCEWRHPAAFRPLLLVLLALLC